MPKALPPFTVRESLRARRILLKVLPGQGLTVILPKGVDHAYAEIAVAQQADWAHAALKELRARGQLFEAPSLPHRVELAAIGAVYSVVCQPGDARRLAMTEREGCLRFRGDLANVEKCLQKLHAWLLAMGKAHLIPWCEALSRETGLPIQSVRIGRQRTRWGSWSTRGTLSLNCCLLFLPEATVRYVILHELCHALHNNHSPAYWREVATREPNWKVLDDSLKEAWRYVPVWAMMY